MPTRQVLPPCLPVLNPARRVSGKRRGARSDTNTIMRVETRQPIQNAGGVAAKARVEGGRGFSLDAAPASASGTGAPAAAATLAGLDAVLLLQGEAETPQERRRRAAKRGGAWVATTLTGKQLPGDGAPVELLGQIPLDTTLREGADHGIPVVVGHPDAPAAVALRGIAKGLGTRARGLAGRSLGLTPSTKL